MHAENFVIHKCCYWQIIEAFCEGLPEFDTVPSLTLVIEPIDSINGGTFMIASEEKEILGVFDLVGKHETDGFEALFAPINVVAEEEIVGLRWEPAELEEPEQVVVLAMYIAWLRAAYLRS